MLTSANEQEGSREVYLWREGGVSDRRRNMRGLSPLGQTANEPAATPETHTHAHTHGQTPNTHSGVSLWLPPPPT